MYNKYFTMKRSELKEAIKAEIKSVLSEEMSPEEVKQKMDQARRGGAKSEPLAKLATIGLEGKTVKIKGNQQEYKVEKVMKNGDISISRDGKNVGTFTPNQLELAEGDLNEGKKGVVIDPDRIMMNINQYQNGNIDGDALAQAIEEILVAAMNKSVTFSDIREEKETLDSVLKKIKDELEIYKTSKDTDKKKAAVEKLKDLNKKKKDLLSKEEEKVANIGRNQELDA